MFKLSVLVPIVLVILSFAFASSAADDGPAAAGNLLLNPSFETNESAGKDESLIPGWSLRFRAKPSEPALMPGEATVIDDAAQAHSGRRFLRFKPANRTLTLNSPQREHGYEPGLYEVSTWARGKPGTTGGIGLYAINAVVGYGFSGLTDQWQKYAAINYFAGAAISPADTPLGMTVFGQGERGQISGAVLDVDDVSLVRLTCGLADTLGDHMVLQRGKPVPIRGWARDSAQHVAISFHGQTKTAIVDKEGRWQVMLDPMPPGGPFVLELDGRPVAYDVMVGDVWICSGQSNMEFGIDKLHGIWGHAPEVIAQADCPQLRLWHASRQFSPEPQHSYRIRQSAGQNDYQARWNVCTPTTVAWGKWGGFSAVGYFFGREIQADQGVAIGLMQICEGGTPIESYVSDEGLRQIPQDQWIVPPISRAASDGLKNTPFPKLPTGVVASTAAYAEQIAGHTSWGAMLGTVDDQKRTYNYASAVYNGVVAPAFPTAVRGVLWFQGENNSLDHHYEPKLIALIADWRARLGDPNLPFVLAQLCNWQSPKAHDGFHRIREAQLRVAQSLPHTALAVTIDLADKTGDGFGPAEIHPKQKKEVGHRMALAARALAYGEQLVSSGPLYRAMKIDNNVVRLSFDQTGGGLQASNGKLTGFMIAGEDHKFLPADSAIEGDIVTVRAKTVPRPVAVRYNYQSFANPLGNLSNKEGLPASPFRTDDWNDD
jgi:sialate O-acetylesterase